MLYIDPYTETASDELSISRKSLYHLAIIVIFADFHGPPPRQQPRGEHRLNAKNF